jgi:hypothetical protein
LPPRDENSLCVIIANRLRLPEITPSQSPFARSVEIAIENCRAETGGRLHPLRSHAAGHPAAHRDSFEMPLSSGGFRAGTPSRVTVPPSLLHRNLWAEKPNADAGFHAVFSAFLTASKMTVFFSMFTRV